MLAPKVAHIQKLGRRDFFKLAAVAGVAASLGGRGLTRLAGDAASLRPAYATAPQNAQYGRARGRYPVARS